MLDKLIFVYGPVIGQQVYEKLEELAAQYAYLGELEPVKTPSERLTEKDVVLITYGDQVQGGSGSHLRTLHGWLRDRLSGIINTVHILPFYPYTSDDGFSVVDYRQVDTALGTWQDLRALRADFRLMFDAVINHISASSDWFQGFLQDDPRYRDYFIVTDPATDLSQVTRPRALPLLTGFQTTTGPKYLWTTFSEDQLDLNFKNPAVFLEIAGLLLFYASQGADLVRLDAIGYMWKEIGTSCIHLPQTHSLIQVLRDLLDHCVPDLLLITETNVPHRDNISYFGDGTNEAQLVYQFPLVPLVLDALVAGNASHLTRWATGLEKMSDTTTFFNFLASHDGIGVVPARSILSEAEIQRLVERTLAHGGQVSYKNNPDGSQSPYELNITFFDALSDPADTSEDIEIKASRFMVSQAIMLALQGVPGIYFHSLLGSANWQQGFNQTGRNRTLNREKLALPELERRLDEARGSLVFERYTALIKARTGHPAFHPNAAQRILPLTEKPELFGILRTAQDGRQVLALHNVSDRAHNFNLEPERAGLKRDQSYIDLVSRQNFKSEPDGQMRLEIKPFQVLWLAAD